VDKDISLILKTELSMSSDNLDKKSTTNINSQHHEEFININSHLYEELQREAEEKHFTMKDYVEIILDRHSKRNQMINRIWPELQIAGVDENIILVVNIIDKKFFNVRLHDKYLFCEQDKSTGCNHTAFVWMQAEDLDFRW
jgi:adenylate kinase